MTGYINGFVMEILHITIINLVTTVSLVKQYISNYMFWKLYFQKTVLFIICTCLTTCLPTCNFVSNPVAVARLTLASFLFTSHFTRYIPHRNLTEGNQSDNIKELYFRHLEIVCKVCKINNKI